MASGLITVAAALDPQVMLTRFGAWAVLVVDFAETALPVMGVLLPGGTLLLPAEVDRDALEAGVSGSSVPDRGRSRHW